MWGDLVTVSLTSVLPALAPSLGMTPTALYERKRALIKLGMLPSPQGRGRRSGAAATPDTVALLIIAALATDSLSETDERVEKLAITPLTASNKGTSRFKPVGRLDRCRWTGTRTFVDAVAFLLSPAAPIRPWPKPDGHTAIKVQRNREELAAQIYFGWASPGFSQFGRFDYVSDRITVEAELPFEALRSIHQILNTTTTEETS